MDKIRMTITISVFTLLTLTICAQGQGLVVDQFKVKNDSVKVFFYDPVLALEKTPNFQVKSEKDKSDTLDTYLHNSALYMFEVTNAETKEITYLCIRGNPDKVNTKMFYKVEVIKGITNSLFNSNDTNYSDKIVKVIDKVNCGGTLFESMEMFKAPENQKYIGSGIQFWGFYRRVQPYSEIKTSMIAIINQL